MEPLWQSDASAQQWESPAKFSIGYPRSGDIVTGAHPTHVGGHWFEGMSQEIQNVVEGAGLVYDPTSTTQFLAAIKIILGIR